MHKCNDSSVAQNATTTEGGSMQTLRRLQVRSLHAHGRKRVNADSWLTALESRYAENMQATGQIVRAMAHESDNDGRGTVADSALGVNATEVRHSERWLGKRDESKDYGCYSIRPDGTRVPFEPSSDDKPRQAPKPAPAKPYTRLRKTYL